MLEPAKYINIYILAAFYGSFTLFFDLKTFKMKFGAVFTVFKFDRAAKEVVLFTSTVEELTADAPSIVDVSAALMYLFPQAAGIHVTLMPVTSSHNVGRI